MKFYAISEAELKSFHMAGLFAGGGDTVIPDIKTIQKRKISYEMNLLTYLAARRKTIEASIAAEKLSGNTVKLNCELSALAEITAIEKYMQTSTKCDRSVI